MNILGSGTGYELFKEEAEKKTYVDKSMLVPAFYKYANEINKYVCVTRPRRFGKSVAANMIAAFFDESTAGKSEKLFKVLEVGKFKSSQKKVTGHEAESSSCWKEQGKLKVIRLNMIEMISDETTSYQKFRQTLNRLLKEDITAEYPDIAIDSKSSLPEILSKTGDSFVFVIDEWDAILR